MEKLPRKTQTILSKFEMLVIAKVVGITEQTASPSFDDRLDIDDIDLLDRMQNQEESKDGADGHQKTYLCEAMVEQLVAFDNLQFTVYNHLYHQ